MYADLGELAARVRAGHEREDECIICCNLGLAIDDVATAILIYQRAVERGIGTWLPL